MEGSQKPTLEDELTGGARVSGGHVFENFWQPLPRFLRNREQAQDQEAVFEDDESTGLVPVPSTSSTSATGGPVVDASGAGGSTGSTQFPGVFDQAGNSAISDETHLFFADRRRPAVYEGEGKVPFGNTDKILLEEEVRCLAVDDRGALYVGSAGHTVRSWYGGQELVQAFSTHTGTANAIVLKRTADYMHAFFAKSNGVITVWKCRVTRLGPFKPWKVVQTASNRFNNIIKSFGRDQPRIAISCLCLSDDGDFLYSGSRDTLNVWRISPNCRRFSFVERLRGPTGVLSALAAGPGVLIAASGDSYIRIWRRSVDFGTVRHTLIGRFFIEVPNLPLPREVRTLFFHKVTPVSGWLYAGTVDHKVRCWKNLLLEHLQDHRIVVPQPEVMDFHTGAVTCLASCGPLLFSGAADGTIAVWKKSSTQGENHTLQVVLRGHQNSITCLATCQDRAMAHDGVRPWILYSGSEDKHVLVWRVYEQPLTTTSARVLSVGQYAASSKRWSLPMEVQMV